MRQCVRSQFSLFAQNCNRNSRLSAYSAYRYGCAHCARYKFMLHFTIYGTPIAHTDFEPQTSVRTALISVTHIQSQIN